MRARRAIETKILGVWTHNWPDEDNRIVSKARSAGQSGRSTNPKVREWPIVLKNSYFGSDRQTFFTEQSDQFVLARGSAIFNVPGCWEARSRLTGDPV